MTARCESGKIVRQGKQTSHNENIQLLSTTDGDNIYTYNTLIDSKLGSMFFCVIWRTPLKCCSAKQLLVKTFHTVRYVWPSQRGVWKLLGKLLFMRGGCTQNLQATCAIWKINKICSKLLFFMCEATLHCQKKLRCI